MTVTKVLKSNVKVKMIEQLNRFKRLHGYFPRYLSIKVDELASLREELNLSFDTDLTEIYGIKLKVIDE